MSSGRATEVTIVGYPFQPTGMAEHARSTFRAFQAAGVTPRLLDVADANRDFDPDLERDFAPHLVTTLGEGVNLFGVNGDEAARVIARVGEPAFSRSYNIAYPAWELARYPKAWAEAASDAVRGRAPERRLVFLHAWNDWEIGAALSPDLRFGHGWLEAVANAADADLLG